MKKALLILTLLLLGNVVVHAGGVETCEPTIIYRDKIVEVEKEVYFHSETEKRVNVTRKNRLSLLLGNGPSNDVSVSRTPVSASITHEDDNFAGLLYQRDFNRFTLGGFGDTNKSVGVSIGVNW